MPLPPQSRPLSKRAPLLRPPKLPPERPRRKRPLLMRLPRKRLLPPRPHLLRRPRPLPPLKPPLRLKPPRPRKRRKLALPLLKLLLRLKYRLLRPRKPQPQRPRKARPPLRKMRSLPRPCRKRLPYRPCPRGLNTARPSRRMPFRPNKRPHRQKNKGRARQGPPLFCFLASGGDIAVLPSFGRCSCLSAAGQPARSSAWTPGLRHIFPVPAGWRSSSMRTGCPGMAGLPRASHGAAPTHAIKRISRTACRQNGNRQRPRPSLPFRSRQAPRYCHPPVVRRYGPEGPVVPGARATAVCQRQAPDSSARTGCMKKAPIPHGTDAFFRTAGRACDASGTCPRQACSP